ncbi:vancomycin resistance protein YoaR [Paenibacillus sp. DS2015]|uniref:VanW family protein n=1 Tax=Paenibacillus sp. DS2015 TaxID=3373917 RepID=UPI003D1E8C60
MKKIHLSLIATATILLIGSLLFGWFHLYVNQPTIPKGVQVAGWHVGGMQTDDVLKQLNNKLTQLEHLPVRYEAEHQNIPDLVFTLSEAGVRYEADTFREAIAQLQEGSWLARISNRWNFQPNWTITSHLDTGLLKSKLNPAWEKQYFGPIIDASRRISEKDQIIYTPEISASRLDWNKLLRNLTSIIPKDFTLITNAQITASPLTLQLPVIIKRPIVTVNSLKKEGIERKITEFSTSLFSSSPGRIFNVNSAAQAVNGMIIKPGEEFDYSKVIKQAETKYGFQEAPVIINGKLAPGIGGGICQVSSTIYHAAILTGMEIVERRNHSIPVSYLPLGQDATFASGSINFRFKNNTGKYLLIHATVQENMLTVKFYGTFREDTQYLIESITVETLPASNKYVQNATLAVGSQEVLQDGKTGYIVETFQVKKVKGVVVDKKRISRDTYRPQSRLIAVHPDVNNKGMAPSPPAKSIVEDGVRGPDL